MTLTSYFYRLGKQIFGWRIGDRGDVADEEDRSNTAFPKWQKTAALQDAFANFGTTAAGRQLLDCGKSSAAFRLALRF